MNSSQIDFGEESGTKPRQHKMEFRPEKERSHNGGPSMSTPQLNMSRHKISKDMGCQALVISRRFLKNLASLFSHRFDEKVPITLLTRYSSLPHFDSNSTKKSLPDICRARYLYPECTLSIYDAV